MSDPPEIDTPLRSPRRWLVAVMVVAFVGLLLLFPVQVPGRWLGVLFDCAHLPVFAVLVFVVIRVLGGLRPNWLLAAAVLVGAVVFGLGAEFTQGLIGRSAGWGDASANAVGACIGFVASTWHRWQRWPRAVAVLVLMGLAAWAYFEPAAVLTDVVRQRSEFPLVGSFENELELRRWQVKTGQMSRSGDHVSHGESSLRVKLEPGEYPGLRLRWPPNDWSGYSTLSFDVWNDADIPLEVVVRVHDFTHNNDHLDRFNREATIKPGANTLTVSLSEVRTAPTDRELDITAITQLQIYSADLSDPYVLYFDRFELK